MNISTIFSFLEYMDDTLWSFVGVPLILFIGIYFSFKSRFVQIRKFPAVIKYFFKLLKAPVEKDGVHPLKVFFACVGGCVGIGNIVGVCIAVQFGGPGALFWVWMSAIFGTMLKYAEVYLGVKHRVSDGKGGYLGGPMYFLQKATKTMWVPILSCVFLCIYGIEIFQFSIITTSVSVNFGIDKLLVTLVLLAMVLWAGIGGVKRVGELSAVIIPFFVMLFIGMGCWVLFQEADKIPLVLKDVFSHAFTGHAAFGGFLGAGVMLTISEGIRRGCYSGDLGIGYASVIHSETSVQSPAKQASLTIFDLFLDTFIICSTSIMIVLVSGAWQEQMDTAMLIQHSLSQYFPYMEVFMPIFLFMLGYSTINAYFVVGIKSAEFISPKWGKKLYFAYAAAALFFFSFVDSYEAVIVMSLTSLFLLILNSWGAWKLRHEISYDFAEEEEGAMVAGEIG